MPIYIQQLTVVGISFILIILLLLDKFKASFLFFMACLIFLLAGIINTGDLLDAISNESILSIFLLIFIVDGLKDNFNLLGRIDKLFRKVKNPRKFMLKMTSITAIISSCINNTPIVALFMPYIYQWSKKHNISSSKLLIPLSYATMLGGMMTVIGTSTNLVLDGLIHSKGGVGPGILDYLIPGVAVTVGGVLFLYLFGYKMLPDRKPVLTSLNKISRKYLIEVRVLDSSSVIGETIVDAGLRNLSGLYLFEIIRNKKRLTPVEPKEIICKDDKLIFAGDTENLIELLEREKDFTMPLADSGEETLLNKNIIETVIPINSNLIGYTLKEKEFRENYDGAVIAIHRNGEQLSGKIGEIKLSAGDLLLISPGTNFQHRINQKNDLYLVSVVSKSKKINPMIMRGFLAVLTVCGIALFFSWIKLFFALLLITTYMISFKLIGFDDIKKSLDFDLLLILISSLAFGTAVINSGVAGLLANNMIGTFLPFGKVGIILGIYLLTLLFTSFLPHIAAIAIVFPIAYGIIQQMPELNPISMYITIAFAASASFHVPFTYQTNLMIYGPGNYKFIDFLKVGTPITLIYSVIALSFIFLYY